MRIGQKGRFLGPLLLLLLLLLILGTDTIKLCFPMLPQKARVFVPEKFFQVGLDREYVVTV
jgi:hypothetical protein